MSETYDIRKLGGDKIALLGLFALSLLTARFVVGLRSALLLSEPIPLPRTGLSVSMPTGNGWQAQKKWIREGDAAVLSSSFTLGTGAETAYVVCRHLINAETVSPEKRFEQKARDIDGYVVEINKFPTATLTFLRAHIKGRDRPVTVFLSTTILPDGSQLDIEAFELTGDVDQAEQAFRGVAESVRFEDSRLRTAASQII